MRRWMAAGVVVALMLTASAHAGRFERPDRLQQTPVDPFQLEALTRLAAACKVLGMTPERVIIPATFTGDVCVNYQDTLFCLPPADWQKRLR